MTDRPTTPRRSRRPEASGRVVALSGGVGGAKLAYGLSFAMDPERLVIVANTGDDFEHLGLHISPDLDTIMYSLAGLSDPGRGWGRRDETWNFMAALDATGGETWFRLGDRDLATHIVRTQRLRGGATLSEVTRALCERLGVRSTLLPMSDSRVQTRLLTEEGWLDFQEYFVRRRCVPVIRKIQFDGARFAKPSDAVLKALSDPDLRCIVVCPSNPFISIDPILSIPGIREALQSSRAKVVAVSPIIAGEAVKGPAAKIMKELGYSPSAATVAHCYSGLIDGFVFDRRDAAIVTKIDVPATTANTLMRDDSDKQQLAEFVLDFADSLASAKVRARS